MKILSIENYENDHLTVLVGGDYELICKDVSGLISEIEKMSHLIRLENKEGGNEHIIKEFGSELVKWLNLSSVIDLEIKDYFESLYSHQLRKLATTYENAILSGEPKDTLYEISKAAAELSDLECSNNNN